MAEKSSKLKIRVGPAGWSYPDWKGIVYPRHPPKGFHEATYLADYFDTIEVNVTYYRPVSSQTAGNWIKRVHHNANFMFTAKLWQEFTHHGNLTAKNEQDFLPGMEVLHHAGRLGALLAQFPMKFHNTPENRTYLQKLTDRFRDFPFVVEFRHGSWDKPEVYSLLTERNVGFCNIDQPLIGHALKPGAQATSRVGYIRLHGRNYDAWFPEKGEGKESRAERYNYLYTLQELELWLELVRNLDAPAIYIILNNHPFAKSLVNAFQILHALTGEKLNIPELLLPRYPELESISSSDCVVPKLFPRKD